MAKGTAKPVKELAKTRKVRFVKGQSGNPAGWPVGSKNKVNILKISLEEGFRDGNYEKIAMILNDVVEDAIQGDKSARKMVWDACISKAALTEDRDDKSSAPTINIRHMDINKQGDIIDVTPIGDDINE